MVNPIFVKMLFLRKKTRICLGVFILTCLVHILLKNEGAAVTDLWYTGFMTKCIVC